MLNIEEYLTEIEVLQRDSKARRRINTSQHNKVNITLKELNDGISIEAIEAIDAQVYIYGHQITIHGMFNDIPQGSLRAAGYKSLIKNQNGSLGVKWIAIDGGKKRKLIDIYYVGNREWQTYRDSQGFYFYKRITDRQEAITAMKSVPDDCFFGYNKSAKDMWGNYIILIEVSGIYEKDFWKLAEFLTGIGSESEYQEIKNKKEKEQIEKDKSFRDEWAERDIQINNRTIAADNELAKLYPLATDIIDGGYYVKASVSHDLELKFRVWKIKKDKRFKRLLKQGCRYNNISDITKFNDLITKSVVITADVIINKFYYMGTQ